MIRKLRVIAATGAIGIVVAAAVVAFVAVRSDIGVAAAALIVSVFSAAITLAATVTALMLGLAARQAEVDRAAAAEAQRAEDAADAEAERGRAERASRLNAARNVIVTTEYAVDRGQQFTPFDIVVSNAGTEPILGLHIGRVDHYESTSGTVRWEPDSGQEGYPIVRLLPAGQSFKFPGYLVVGDADLVELPFGELSWIQAFAAWRDNRFDDWVGSNLGGPWPSDEAPSPNRRLHYAPTEDPKAPERVRQRRKDRRT